MALSSSTSRQRHGRGAAHHRRLAGALGAAGKGTGAGEGEERGARRGKLTVGGELKEAGARAGEQDGRRCTGSFERRHDGARERRVSSKTERETLGELIGGFYRAWMGAERAPGRDREPAGH